MARNSCPKCNRELSANAVRCPACGQYIARNIVKFGFAALYVILVTVFYYRWMQR
ncbi:MAG: zinc ribbon domain-containing protein [Deltaproteobacteria bacterium]|nr:zinc ribbon domain-containing protein [Deltaproteobacteria bacterium]